MSVSPLLRALEEQLQCCICMGPLKDPRLLPCQHSLCLECLERMAEDGLGDILRMPRSASCPECRAPFRIPREGAAFMPVHRALANLAIATAGVQCACCGQLELQELSQCLGCEQHTCKQCSDSFCVQHGGVVCSTCGGLGGLCCRLGHTVERSAPAQTQQGDLRQALMASDELLALGQGLLAQANAQVNRIKEDERRRVVALELVQQHPLQLLKIHLKSQAARVRLGADNEEIGIANKWQKDVMTNLSYLKDTRDRARKLLSASESRSDEESNEALRRLEASTLCCRLKFSGAPEVPKYTYPNPHAVVDRGVELFYREFFQSELTFSEVACQTGAEEVDGVTETEKEENPSETERVVCDVETHVETAATAEMDEATRMEETTEATQSGDATQYFEVEPLVDEVFSTTRQPQPELIDTLSASRSSGIWRRVVWIFITAILAAFAWDVYAHGGVQGSKSAAAMERVGAAPHIAHAYNRVSSLTASGATWLSDRAPDYCSKSWAAVKPALVSTSEKVQYGVGTAVNATRPVLAVAAQHCYDTAAWVYSLAPEWFDLALTYCSRLWQLLLDFYHAAVTWLLQNVFTGQLSPAKVQASLVWVLTSAREHLVSSFNFCVDKLQGNTVVSA